MPKSFYLLLTEWTNEKLETFRSTKLRGVVAQAYHKRQYMYDHIDQQRQDQGMLSLTAAAKALDRERVGRRETMPAVYKNLKDADNRIVRRNKRPRMEETPPRRPRNPPPPPPPPPPPRPPLPPTAAARAFRGVPFPNRRNPGLAAMMAWDADWQSRRTPHQRRCDRESDIMMAGSRPTQWEATGHTSGARFVRDNDF
jgi:hypothetical protein